jgi:hypothetical protein
LFPVSARAQAPKSASLKCEAPKSGPQTGFLLPVYLI